MEHKLEDAQAENNENQTNVGSDVKEKLTINEDCIETFWISYNISYSTDTDKMGNYYFQLVNYSTGKIYQEYLSPVQVSSIEGNISPNQSTSSQPSLLHPTYLNRVCVL